MSPDAAAGEQAAADQADEQAEPQADLSEDDLAATPDEADVDEAAIAEQVAEETSRDEDDEETEQADEKAGDQEMVQPEDVVEGDVSLGHVYCQGLGVASAVAVSRYDEDANRDQLVDEYADLARQMDLDRYMDQWVESQGRGSDLSPGQALAVFSVVFCASVMVANPEVAEGLAEEVGL